MIDRQEYPEANECLSTLTQAFGPDVEVLAEQFRLAQLQGTTDGAQELVLQSIKEGGLSYLASAAVRGVRPHAEVAVDAIMTLEHPER